MNSSVYLVLAALIALFSEQLVSAAEPTGSPRANVVDATTLHHKIICGYQGWFRCPGDGTDEGWMHWSRSREKITPKSLTFEMWPDMSELAESEKFEAKGFTYPGGDRAFLFSSARRETVQRHFRWMKEYGLDGVFVQRFLVNLGTPSFDDVLDHVRASAAETGRVYALCYDLTAAPRDKIFDLLTADWKRLVDEKRVTQDDRYLHHAGKPVLVVWGFFDDRFGSELAHRIIDFFKSDDRYRVTLIGGCQWYWRNTKDKEWARAFRRFDAISPWNVGNVVFENGRKQASTGPWRDDLAEAKKAGMEYLPVIYPGFGWTNLKGAGAARQTIPRLGGEFYWRQFVTAAKLDIDMAYVAMFDEVDEGTAIFKVTNDPPTQAKFATFEGLPTDWYLRLTAEGGKLLRRESKIQTALPIAP